MKKILFALAAIIFLAQCTPKTADKTADNSNTNIPTPVVQPTPDGGLDRSIPPKPGPAPKIQIGDYETFKLSNGVEVIVVENSKLPRVSFNIALDVDPMMEGDKAGLVDITGQLLRRGTKTRTKQELDEQVDFIGATLSTSGRGIFGSSLTKHQDELLQLMSDVLLNSTFPEEELEKLKTQTKSALASQKDDPNAIAGNVAGVLNFSKKHPYGEIETPETIENITRKDCKKYFDTYFKPNTTQLVVVGDVDAAKLQEQLEKYFGKWKEGEVPTQEYKTPPFPKATEVAFVNKEGAVQSVINITYPVDLKPGSKDAIAASVMNTILGGGGFSGYLMQNLREDKAYTYGAYSRLSRDELVGSFTASASVRNEVTDSAIVQFLYEMNRMRTEPVAEDHLKMVLNKMTGSFARSLERPQTIANFAMNIVRYDLPNDYYQTYLEKLNSVTPADIQRVADKYIRPEQAHILVVGNKDEVMPKLAKFSKSGKVMLYDEEGNEIKPTTVEVDKNMTADVIVAKYVEAIGGDKWDDVKSYDVDMAMSTMGMTLAGKQIKSEGKFLLEITMMGQTAQKIVYDGEKALMFNPQAGEQIIEEGDELESMKEQAMMVPEAAYGKLGYTLELKGTDKVDGKDAYKVLVAMPDGKKKTEYYDMKSGLKLKEIQSEESPAGAVTTTTVYKDYKEVNGLKMAHTMETTQSMGAQSQNITMTIKSVKVNEELAEDTFLIKKK